MINARPILFSLPMVRAILDGLKTQTRRIVKPELVVPDARPLRHAAKHPGPYFDSYCSERKTDQNPRGMSDRWCWWTADDRPDPTTEIRCPYGAPGDRLWVREVHFRFGHWETAVDAKPRTRTGRQRWRFVADTDEIRFEPPTVFRKGRHHKDHATPAWHKRLARFMPRAASRITLEVTRVCVQRLQEINEDDARAEGMSPSLTHVGLWHNPLPEEERSEDYVASALDAFGLLWQRLNGVRAPWSSNPWVWAISFARGTP